MRALLNRFVRVLAVLGTVAAFCLPASVANADNVEPIHYRISGESAYAIFQSVDPSGCILTLAFVQVVDGTIRQTGRPETSTQANLTILQLNFCTFEGYAATSQDTLAAGEFQIDNQLTGATLDKIFLVSDLLGASYPVEVSLSWTGVGEVETTRQHLVDRPPFMAIYHSAGRFSNAAATGLITDGVTNFAPETSQFAEIGSFRLMQLAAYHGQ